MKKLFKIAIILFVFILFVGFTVVYGADVNMNLSNTNSTDTIYGNSSNMASNPVNDTMTNSTTKSDTGTSSSTINVGTSSSLSSSELGASTIVNIILVVVGVLLILLGIAILIRVR